MDRRPRNPLKVRKEAGHPHRNALWCVLGAALTAALAVSAFAAPAGPPLITVKAAEFAFDVRGDVEVVKARSGPATAVLGAGEVLFRVTNVGLIEHNFAISDPKGRIVAEVPVLSPGQTQELRVRLKRGAYTILCTFPGHQALGMQVDLQVR